MNLNPQKKNNAADLFEQLRSGSQDALKGILLMFRQRLMAYISIYIPDRDMATSIFNDTMLVLWEHRQKVAAFDNPYTWLTNVAYHKAINARRNKKTYQLMLKNNASAQEPFSSMEAKTEFKELLRFIERAEEQLPPKEKLVFNLFIQNGWSSRQIAQYCNASENTVRNQLNSAIKKIRKQLSNILNGIFI